MEGLRPRPVLAVAVSAGLVVAALATVIVVARSPGAGISATKAVRIVLARASATASGAPSGDTGAFPLTGVPTPFQISQTLDGLLVAGRVPITVRPGNEQPVTVSRQIDPQSYSQIDCVSILGLPPAEPASWGVSGSCGVDGKNQAFYYPFGYDPRRVTPPRVTIVYYIWSQVPDGTEYVTFRSPLLQTTQRPIKGIVAVPVKDGPVNAILTAIGTDGRRLGQAQFLKCYDGTQYLPAHVQSYC
jgi:hypothetical protein